MEGKTDSRKLQALINEEWDLRMEHDPLFATECGDHRFNDRLPRVSAEDVLIRERILGDIQAKTGTINVENLNPSEEVNFSIFKRTLENEINEIKFKTHLMPLSKAFSFHLSFPELFEFVPLSTIEDYENYISRLASFRRYVDDQIDQMREGCKKGYVPARAAIEGIDKSLSSQIVEDAADSPLNKPFQKMPSEFGDADRERLILNGRKAIEESVSEAYKSLLTFVNEEYLEAARGEVGALALPEGEAFYNHRIRMFTSLELAAEEIHQIGKEEVGRLRNEMLEVIRQVKFTGDFREFVKFLRSDPQFYVETADELLKEVSYILKKMDGELPALFMTLPRMPYGIRPIPDFSAPGTTTAYYFPPAGDGTRAGIYYVNTYDLGSRPLYEIEALSLHEAVPGHHLQIALQQELGDIPNFRRFDYLTSTAFVEGWALYAERLGLEVGFYQDPYSNFGRLSYEMWRACRLVVDTGIHALGWDRERAVSFMTENTSLSDLNIANEVDRYIAWPGQSLAYKMGEITIRELRKKAEIALGSKFDLRAFHDEILRRGAVPLHLLEIRINSWIEEQNSPAIIDQNK